MKQLLWGLVGVLTLLRLLGAFTLPMTGDEAYYWEWSRRLAFGYIDHPGGVAWIIAALHWAGNSPGSIRLGFWLCGVVATAAMADCAARIARSRGSDAGFAAGLAALFTTMAPIIVIAFGTVSPDGPFLASWALTLDAATALLQVPAVLPAIATGAAIGLGLESRAFAVALLCGVLITLRKQPRYALIVVAVALTCVIPLIWWNATHAWVMVIFTLVGRHVDEGFSLIRPVLMFAEVILSFGIGLAIAVMWGGGLAIRRKISPLIFWTSIPLVTIVFLLSFFERVETYWLLGPYLSLSVAAAVLIAERSFAQKALTRIAIAAPPLLLLSVLYVLIFATLPVAHFAAERLHLRLHKGGLFHIFGVESFARDLQPVVARRHAIVFADGYGLSAMLDYYGGFPPIVIGYSWQGRELQHWYNDAPIHGNGLFVDTAPLRERPDFAKQLALACARLEPGPDFRYAKGDLPILDFPTTWCLDMKPNAIAILRWEHTR